ncbi:hypothetical protein FSP39_010457 [Pinctada imbricata]|uniref:Uncharacterized protein n=1 Tax=Pinctada imbricata TaxID=66713 RepID=A0AA88Y8K4_PINIB|nr:hypothetical protein FSP39_010457 [Pinctada imbricata]
MAIFWLFYLGLVHQVYSDTSSDDLTRCPSRCDTLKELDTLRMDINVLRQLLNQESIIRMNLEEKIQNQQKLIDDMAKEINFVNRSTEEIILETRKLHSEVQEMVGNQSVSSLDTQTNISSLWNSLRTQGQEIHDVNSDTKTNISSLWNSLRTQGQELHDVNSDTKTNISSLWNSLRTQGHELHDVNSDTKTNISSLWNSLRTQGQEIHDVNSVTKTNISSLWNSLRAQGQEIHDVNSENGFLAHLDEVEMSL